MHFEKLNDFFPEKSSGYIPQSVDAALLAVRDMLGSSGRAPPTPEGGLKDLTEALTEAVVRGTFARHRRAGIPVDIEDLIEGGRMDGLRGLLAMGEDVDRGEITGPAAEAISKSLRLFARHSKSKEDAGIFLIIFRKMLSEWRDGGPYVVWLSEQ